MYKFHWFLRFISYFCVYLTSQLHIFYLLIGLLMTSSLLCLILCLNCVDSGRSKEGYERAHKPEKQKNYFHKTSQKYINKTHTTKLILKINIVVNITHSKRINGDCGQ